MTRAIVLNFFNEDGKIGIAGHYRFGVFLEFKEIINVKKILFWLVNIVFNVTVGTSCN